MNIITIALFNELKRRIKEDEDAVLETVNIKEYYHRENLIKDLLYIDVPIIFKEYTPNPMSIQADSLMCHFYSIEFLSLGIECIFLLEVGYKNWELKYWSKSAL